MWLVDKGSEMDLDFLEVRYQRFSSTKIEMRDGKVFSATPGEEEGIAIRSLRNGVWGFSTTSDLDKKSLLQALKYSVKGAKSKRKKREVKLAPAPVVEDEVRIKVREELDEVPIEDKISWLRRGDEEARSIDGVKATSTYWDYKERKVVVNSDGTFLKIENSWIFFDIWAYATKNGVMQSYRERFATLGGFESTEKIGIEERCRKAAKKALELTEAKPAPGGRFPVVIDGVLSGLLAHEAVGHATEADSVLRGLSVLKGKIGEKIGSEHVTLIDDATLGEMFGSDKYDDEGVQSKRKVLIKNGVLKGYLTNRETSGELGLPLTGNARAQDYRHPPLVRMTNTFFKPGDMDLDELLEGIKRGIYAKGGRGGQVSPAEGVFQFGAQEAYVIEKGEIGERLRDFSMSGFILETLKKVSGVSKDFDVYPSFCGKGGQWMRNTTGGPHLRIEEITVGGK